MPRSSQPTYVFSGGSGEDVPARTLRQVEQLLPVKIWQGVPSDVPVEVVDVGRYSRAILHACLRSNDAAHTDCVALYSPPLP